MIDLGFIKVDSFTFFAILVGIALFVVQLVLAFKVRYLILKLLPTVLVIIAAIVCFAGLISTESWDALGWLLLLIYDLIYIAVDVFAWIVYGVVRIFKK